MSTNGGAVSLGANVEYTYVVTNPNDDTVTGVTVDDDKLGNIASKIEAFLVKYTGPDVVGPTTVEIVPKSFDGVGVIHDFPGGLFNGDTLSLPAEAGFSVDASSHDLTDLGAQTSLYINGVEENIHTSCSTPFTKGAPAPLNNPKGDPSSLWFVLDFTQKIP